MKIKASLCVFASLLLSFTDASLEGTWPPMDQPPPPVPSWTALVDQSKVAKAPLVNAADVGIKCPAKDTFCNWSCTGCTRNVSDITKCPTKGDWGLTFDDGPTPFTTGLLDFFLKTNTKVTFFVIGSRVFENPEILQRAVKEGHQIGVHTWSHPSLTSQSNEQIIAELKWTELAIQKAVGLTPKYMRPPFGDYDDRVRNIATQLGYKIVIWDEDTNDWMSADDKTFQLTWIEGNFTQWVKEPATTGHISLEHDLYKQTAARAQLAAPIVTGAGFLIKPVAVCVGDPKPYVEDVTLGQLPSGAPAPAATPAGANPPPAAPTPADASPADASPADEAYPSAPPPTGTSSGSGPYPYLVGSGDASSVPSPTSTTSAASLNSINLLSFVSLIAGSFMLI